MPFKPCKMLFHTHKSILEMETFVLTNTIRLSDRELLMNHKICCYRDLIKPQKHLFVKMKVILYLFDLLYIKSNIYIG